MPAGSPFQAGHIPGAIPLAFQNVADEHKAKLAGFDTLIVYGDDYGDPKPNAMSKRLIELGYSDVRTLEGGVQAWTEAGYRLEKGDEAASRMGPTGADRPIANRLARSPGGGYLHKIGVLLRRSVVEVRARRIAGNRSGPWDEDSVLTRSSQGGRTTVRSEDHPLPWVSREDRPGTRR